MKGRRVGWVLTALALAFVLLAGVIVAAGVMVPTGRVAAAPEDALYWCGSNTYCSVTLQSVDGITTSAASENYARQGGSIVFNRAELYCTMDEGSLQTQTVKLQYSADGTNWIDHLSGACAAQTADGTVAVSLTNLAGTYWRAYATLGTTYTTTPTIRLVLKRTQ